MIGIARAHANQMNNYTNWLKKRNFKHRILDKGDSMQDITLLLLCGGPDVGANPDRDEAEYDFLRKAFHRKLPILGICRGLQITNVFMGGTLHEDLSETPIKHTSNKVQIAGEPSPLLESSFHNIEMADGSMMRVNSRHHQGIKDIAVGLKSCAICKEDNLPEMVEGDKILLVQWHPEREDVWGTEAESIVYTWLKANYIESEIKISPASQIISYMRKKGFNVISFERAYKLNETFTESFIHNLITENPGIFKHVKDKHGRAAIKKL